MISRLLENICVLCLSLLAGGLLSVYFGKELGWDLANYHFYHPYALLHHRSQIDFWPTSFIHQYLNPTVDFLTYFLINDVTPRSAEFILGAIHGINFWLLFLIALFFINVPFKTPLALLIALLGMYGPTALPGIGSFQNDNLISIFVLGFVLLQLQGWRAYSQRTLFPTHYLFFSSLLLGIGVGLKFTAGTFVIGMLFATLILPLSRDDKLKSVVIMSIATTLGIAMFAGYWMFMMWQQHHNPFFPFLNHIFHSPDMPAINWHDPRFFPKDFLQTLFYPFYFSWNGQSTDLPFRDFRFPIIYTLFVIALLFSFWNKLQQINLPTRWLYAFFIISYCVWQWYFSNARYLVTLEMLAPLLIYLLITQLISHTYWRIAILVVIFYAIAFFMIAIKFIRLPSFGQTYFEVKLLDFIQQVPKAMVLMTYSSFATHVDPRPQAYFIPFFPTDWRFVGLPFSDTTYSADPKTTATIQSLIAKYDHPIYLLTGDDSMKALYMTAKQFGLKASGKCHEIKSDRQKLSGQTVLLCPTKSSSKV